MIAVGGEAAEGSGIEARSTEKFVTFIFQLSGWALMTPLRFED